VTARPWHDVRILARGLLLIAGFVAGSLALRATGIESMLDERWIDSEVRGNGLVGELVFMAVGVLVTGLGLPRQLVAFLGGYAFGFGLGSVLALLATVGGCAVAFGCARLLGREVVTHWFPHRLRRFDTFVAAHPFLLTLLIRLLPVGSNLLTNLAAGVSTVRTVPFLAGSTVGYVPQIVVFALAGSGVAVDPGWRIGLAVVLFVVSSALGVHLYRIHRRRSAAAVIGTETPSDPDDIGADGATASRRRAVDGGRPDLGGGADAAGR
jgi:uncharacterized membrane protein YdjX (TVP38/TMEM64 family)